MRLRKWHKGAPTEILPERQIAACYVGSCCLVSLLNAVIDKTASHLTVLLFCGNHNLLRLSDVDWWEAVKLKTKAAERELPSSFCLGNLSLPDPNTRRQTQQAVAVIKMLDENTHTLFHTFAHLCRGKRDPICHRFLFCLCHFLQANQDTSTSCSRVRPPSLHSSEHILIWSSLEMCRSDKSVQNLDEIF